MPRLLMLAALAAVPTLIVSRLAVPGPAAAAETGFSVKTATELTQLCAGRPPGEGGPAARDNAVTFCHGFAQGVVSVLKHQDPRAFCVPSPGPSRTQTMGEYALWVQGRPGRGDEQAGASFAAFMKERFPCGG